MQQAAREAVEVVREALGQTKLSAQAHTKQEMERAGLPTVAAVARADPNAPPMRAVAWFGKHDVCTINAPRPAVTDPHDAVLKVTSTCICGSDLHLFEGCV